MRLVRAVAVLVVVVCGAAAHAQRATLLDPDDPDTQAAKRHFQRGSKLYTEERYQEAIAEFEKARALRPLPAFDFNIGRCEDRLEHWSAAAEAYERYLAAAPGAPESAELRERIEVLRAREPKPAVTAPPVEKPATTTTLVARPPERKPLVKRPWFWLAVGGGVAVVTTAIVVGVILARPGDPSRPIMDLHF